MSLVATVGPTGGTKNRLDIVDFVQDEKFLTLYLRALQAVQARDQRDWESFFQVAGIHGLPFTEPYIALYEQTIQEAAIDAAKKFTVDEEAWVQAAQDLRQPYWDWGF